LLTNLLGANCRAAGNHPGKAGSDQRAAPGRRRLLRAESRL